MFYYTRSLALPYGDTKTIYGLCPERIYIMAHKNLHCDFNLHIFSPILVCMVNVDLVQRRIEKRVNVEYLEQRVKNIESLEL